MTKRLAAFSLVALALLVACQQAPDAQPTASPIPSERPMETRAASTPSVGSTPVISARQPDLFLQQLGQDAASADSQLRPVILSGPKPADSIRAVIASTSACCGAFAFQTTVYFERTDHRWDVLLRESSMSAFVRDGRLVVVRGGGGPQVSEEAFEWTGKDIVSAGKVTRSASLDALRGVSESARSLDFYSIDLREILRATLGDCDGGMRIGQYFDADADGFEDALILGGANGGCRSGYALVSVHGGVPRIIASANDVQLAIVRDGRLVTGVWTGLPKGMLTTWRWNGQKFTPESSEPTDLPPPRSPID